MTRRARAAYPAPIERLSALRGQLDELRRAGTASNITLEILTELTEIVMELAHLAVLERSTEVSA